MEEKDIYWINIIDYDIGQNLIFQNIVQFDFFYMSFITKLILIINNTQLKKIYLLRNLILL
jgi:hypothetical protein